MRLFATGGLEALSMRAIARQVGVSPMTPYRYFKDKVALLSGMWQFSLEALHERTALAVAAAEGGRARQRAFFNAYLDFWESHPNDFWLVHITQGLQKPDDATQVPIYGRLLGLLRQTTKELADEIGAKMMWAKLSEDVSFAMLLGYLQAVMIRYRYPWGRREVLRAAYIEHLMACKEQCLLDGPAPRPELKSGARGKAVRKR